MPLHYRPLYWAQILRLIVNAEFYAHVSSSANDISAFSAQSVEYESSYDLESSSDEFIVFPNPNAGDFEIELKSSNSKLVEILISDFEGGNGTEACKMVMVSLG